MILTPTGFYQFLFSSSYRESSETFLSAWLFLPIGNLNGSAGDTFESNIKPQSHPHKRENVMLLRSSSVPLKFGCWRFKVHSYTDTN